MDTPRSDKTHVDGAEASLAHTTYIDKALKDAGALSAATTAAPSLHNVEVDEKGRAVLLGTTDVDDLPPDGGRGWLVILGCVIFSAATVGWGYVLAIVMNA